MKKLLEKEYVEKRSRFLLFVYEVEDEEDFLQAFDCLAKEHGKARHILRCARYRNRYGVPETTFSEDREPVNAMHRLAQLFERKSIVGHAVFVVRYFGGTKLGASHLDHVYFSLASLALAL